MEASNQTLGLEELLELSISSTDLGTVNFNILRLLLGDLIKKVTKTDKEPVKLGEHDANHVMNYKNYMQGAPVSPMPGIVNYNNGSGQGKPGKGPSDPAQGKGKVPGGPAQGKGPGDPAQGKGPGEPTQGKPEKGPGGPTSAPAAGGEKGGDPTVPGEKGVGPTPAPGGKKGSGPTPAPGGEKGSGPTPAPGGETGGLPPAPGKQGTPRTPNSGRPPPPTNASPRFNGSGGTEPPVHHGILNDLQNQITQLQTQLQEITSLPTNANLLKRNSRGEEKDGMSVNDMWQLIQLNSRIAAAEAAIQKMASLIEDLAKQLNAARAGTSGVKAENAKLAQTSSKLALEVSPLSDKCVEAEKQIAALKEEMDNLKEQVGLVQNATGLDPGKMPTFLKKGKSKIKPGVVPGKDFKNFTLQHMADLSPSLLAGMSPSDLALIPAEALANLTPEQLEKLTPQQISSMTPEQLEKLTPQQMSKMSPEQFEKLTPEQISKMSPEQLEKLNPQKASKVNPEQMSKPTPSKIGKMTPDQVSKLTSSQISKQSPELVQSLPKKKQEQKSKGPRAGPDINNLTTEEVQKLSPSQIKKLSPSEVQNISPEKLAEMTPQQQKQIQKIQKAAVKPPDLAKIPREDIATIPITELDKLAPKDLEKITPSMLDNMTPEQKGHIDKMKKKASEDKAELERKVEHSLEEGDLDDLTASEILTLTKSQVQQLTPEMKETYDKKQKEAAEKLLAPDVDEIDDEVDALSPDDVKRKSKEKKTAADLKEMKAEDIALIPIEDLSQLTPGEIEKITTSTLEMMTPEQKDKLEELKAKRQSQAPNLDQMSPEEVAALTPSVIANLTASEIENISDEAKALMTEEQLDKLEEARLAGQHYEQGEHEHGRFSSSDSHRHSHPETEPKTPEKRRKKPIPSRFRPKGKGAAGAEDMLAEEEFEESLDMPKAALGEHMQMFTMESYLASLPKDQLEAMAADAVQEELQRQYAALQGLQSQLARDIQDKMEVIYQKLLRDIVTQQLVTSPYNVIESPEKCLGPGICKGHGMPAGIAVCQLTDSLERTKLDKSVGGEASCPACGTDALKSLKPPRKGVEKDISSGASVSGVGKTKDTGLDQQAIKDMKSLMVLDLEQIREDLKSVDIGEFDEKDILERLGTLWEAVKVLKTNEDAIAARISKHETLLNKKPAKTVERFIKGPYGDNGDGMAQQSNRDKVYDSPGLQQSKVEEPDEKGEESADRDDIQTLFNNLANVIAECADQKERIDQLVDAVRIIESGMVTKQLLVDTMSEKADKGQINTKVSYDEFGNTVDELHAQLHNLMVEGYQRNENWKKVTADLAEELAEKLDRVELAPIRAFFKSRLKKLEDRVLTMSTLLDEPDPAGTRRKLMKDYNCISCDRRVNISGATNAPILPTIGPAMPTGASPSHRALDIHRLRTQRSRLEAEKRESAALEKQISNQKSTAGSSTGRNDKQLSDKDMMQLVNRYVGSNPTNSKGGLPAMKIASRAEVAPSQGRVSLQQSPVKQLSKQASLSVLSPPMPEVDNIIEE